MTTLIFLKQYCLLFQTVTNSFNKGILCVQLVYLVWHHQFQEPQTVLSTFSSVRGNRSQLGSSKNQSFQCPSFLRTFLNTFNISFQYFTLALTCQPRWSWVNKLKLLPGFWFPLSLGVSYNKTFQHQTVNYLVMAFSWCFSASIY